MANNVPTPINLNDILPASPAGSINVKFQADNNIPRNVSGYVPAGTGTGGVDIQSGATYTLRAADQGAVVVLTNASCAVTADSTLPTNFSCTVLFVGASGGTVTPSSGQIDNQASMAFNQYGGSLLVFDGTNWWAEGSQAFIQGGGGGGGGGLNGVNIQTGDYPIVSGDNGKLVALNSAGSHTFTLPNPPPSTTWAIFVACFGGGSLIVSRNSLNIDGAASNLTIQSGQGCIIFTDGSNYFTDRGIGVATPVSVANGGTGDSTLTTHAVLLGEGTSPVSSTGPGTSGQVLTSNGVSADPSFQSQPYDVVFSPNVVMGSGTVYRILVFTRTVIFPGNFSGSQGKAPVTPGSTQTITVNKNGSSVGTISISVTGVFTFATTSGAAVTFNAGDELDFANQAGADTSMLILVTLAGTR